MSTVTTDAQSTLIDGAVDAIDLVLRGPGSVKQKLRKIGVIVTALLDDGPAASRVDGDGGTSSHTDGPAVGLPTTQGGGGAMESDAYRLVGRGNAVHGRPAGRPPATEDDVLEQAVNRRTAQRLTAYRGGYHQ
jgi:hypothetical protein